MAPTLAVISETVSGSNLAPEYTLKTRFLDFLEFPGLCLEELAEVYQSQFAVVVVVVCLFVYLFVCFFSLRRPIHFSPLQLNTSHTDAEVVLQPGVFKVGPP